MLEEFKSIKQLEAYFKDEEIAREYLEQYRWKGVPTCPICSRNEYYTLKTVKQYCCKHCRKNYSVKVGTIFDNSKVPLTKWYSAIWMLLHDKRSMSSVQMAEWIGVPQRTAWYMDHRIRTMLQNDDNILLTGIVQADEIFTGGKKQKVTKKRKEKMKQGSGSVGKLPVVGLAETATGKKVYITVSDVTAEGLNDILDKHVSKDAILVTDASPLYVNAGKEYASHVSLNHSNDEFGRDGYHGNDIEGSFRHFRVLLDGTFKGMVRAWHMQKYANEFIYKNNARGKKKKNVVIVEKTIMSPENLKRVLRYRDLVILNPNHAEKWKKAS